MCLMWKWPTAQSNSKDDAAAAINAEKPD